MLVQLLLRVRAVAHAVACFVVADKTFARCASYRSPTKRCSVVLDHIDVEEPSQWVLVFDVATARLCFRLSERCYKVCFVACFKITLFKAICLIVKHSAHLADSSMGDRERLFVALDAARHHDRQAHQRLVGMLFQQAHLSCMPYVATAQQLFKRYLHCYPLMFLITSMTEPSRFITTPTTLSPKGNGSG